MSPFWIGVAVVVALVAAWFVRKQLLIRSIKGIDSQVPERRAEPDPDALAVAKAAQDKISFDLERLKDHSADYKPLVEYLSYIQVQRGEQTSLIFVRRRDLASLASLTGLSQEAFVNEFEQMGVLLSMN